MAHLFTRGSARLCAPILRAYRTQHSLHGPIQPLANSPPIVKPTLPGPNAAAHAPQTAGPRPPPPTPARAKPTLRASKAAVTLTPDAVRRLQQLVSGPTPQLIRIGVRNKGCAGMSYHLEYVEKPGRFDEVVEQDGVKVLIDSKALFSIIGSEMHWQEDRMSSKFVFNNPNVVDACGCGESFNIAA
ncbi:Iron-sulfur assembly protein 1 [Ceratobasidium sp. 392]|nr:Iron-sulfur assembly protein 1 [Ceratobasidium sp. 392]